MIKFGKGFVYNLVLFAKHFENEKAMDIYRISFVMNKSESKRKEILSDAPTPNHNYGWNRDIKWWFNKIVPIYGSEERALSADITTWANGASDHLYDLEISPYFRGTDIEEMANTLRYKGLEMGHGFLDNVTYTIDDMKELMDLTEKIALKIDIFNGGNPEEADFN